MAAFCQTLYETNEEPHQLILDEADLWAPQRPIKGWESLLGDIEEIVRRGRVRGFIPWLITQRPAVLHKDVLEPSRHPDCDDADVEPRPRRHRRLD